MSSSAFSLLFATFLLISVAIRLWLATRQIRHVGQHRQRLPTAFEQRIGLSAHQRAADYTIARSRLGMAEQTVSAVVLLLLTLLGGLQQLQQRWQTWLPDNPLWQQMGIVVSAILLIGLFELPLDLWRHFRLESRFGFNRMTPGLFIADRLKGMLVGAVLGLPLLAALIGLMQASGSLWWLWAWLLWTGFSVAMLLIYPAVIAPIFNRFEPMPEGPVRTRIEALLERCRFAASGLFVMDGSRRSAHGNAYFAGMGRSRRIVFFDTLLERLDADEIEAVLAHELGHFKKRHIQKRLVLQIGFSLASFALLGWLSAQPWFYQGLGVTPDPAQPAPAGIALLLFFLVAPVFSFVLRPVMAWLSRRDEFEADAFAVAHSRGQALISALTKLYEDNASTLTPDPVHSAFYDSHPPAAIRIAHIERQLGASTQSASA
ncbi:MAG: M48 family metallopeptidase [Lautropia sp.]|nr:M48 family metallopeptidase [Lautropia sp.]